MANGRNEGKLNKSNWEIEKHLLKMKIRAVQNVSSIFPDLKQLWKIKIQTRQIKTFEIYQVFVVVSLFY